MLQNLGQNIRSVEERIKQLENAKQKPTEEKTEQYNSTVCKVVENTDIMRLQLIFEGVPSADIRSILKSNGFKWSPSNGAWQRQLTDNARYSTKKVIKQLEERKTA
jgi:G3E family GTPase